MRSSKLSIRSISHAGELQTHVLLTMEQCRFRVLFARKARLTVFSFLYKRFSFEAFHSDSVTHTIERAHSRLLSKTQSIAR